MLLWGDKKIIFHLLKDLITLLPSANCYIVDCKCLVLVQLLLPVFQGDKCVHQCKPAHPPNQPHTADLQNCGLAQETTSQKATIQTGGLLKHTCICNIEELILGQGFVFIPFIQIPETEKCNLFLARLSQVLRWN